MRGQKISVTRIATMEEFLKKTWGKKFNKAIETLLDVRPVISNGKKDKGSKMPILREDKHDRRTKDIQVRLLQ